MSELEKAIKKFKTELYNSRNYFAHYIGGALVMIVIIWGTASLGWVKPLGMQNYANAHAESLEDPMGRIILQALCGKL